MYIHTVTSTGLSQLNAVFTDSLRCLWLAGPARRQDPDAPEISDAVFVSLWLVVRSAPTAWLPWARSPLCRPLLAAGPCTSSTTARPRPPRRR